jgi:hypothetical protein
MKHRVATLCIGLVKQIQFLWTLMQQACFPYSFLPVGGVINWPDFFSFLRPVRN